MGWDMTTPVHWKNLFSQTKFRNDSVVLNHAYTFYCGEGHSVTNFGDEFQRLIYECVLVSMLEREHKNQHKFKSH